ncbi:MAG TPA: hypothetical protein DEB16_07090 [Ruminococcaceae bacterium]|nr:hypothetical protein [Oscillospiraceae bacterium]HBT91594.1 hypothetical protein [Oscillospiraceae bacterium]HCB91702.1 hypothetical protein [Oscillospiraceae bacterium]
MTCFFCKGDMAESRTNYFVTLKSGSMLIVKNVPCYKCTQCGEISYSGTVAARLERIVDAMESAMTEIAVVNYPGRVA